MVALPRLRRPHHSHRGVPLILVLAMGRRAESTLPKIRDWMNANSWIVNEAVLAFFLAMALF